MKSNTITFTSISAAITLLALTINPAAAATMAPEQSFAGSYVMPHPTASVKSQSFTAAKTIEAVNVSRDSFSSEISPEYLAKKAAEKAAAEEAARVAAEKAAADKAAAEAAAAAAAKKKTSSSTSSTNSTLSSAPSFTPDPGSAQAYAQTAVAARGWSNSDFNCLVSLWNKESGWRANAMNSSSGAYGIPQALPGSKMASAGADWQTNANTQVDWGLGYIAGRYGTPCAAWSHSGSVGWY